MADIVTSHGRGISLRAAQVALAAAQPRGISALRAGVAPTALLSHREIASFHGLSVGTVLYIGANRGQALPLLSSAFPDAVIHCFEPLPEPFAMLAAACRSRSRWKAYHLAVGQLNGTTTMLRNVSHDEASSLRRPGVEMGRLYPHVEGWQEQEVEAIRLDDWVAGQELEDDILVKLDVQGAEDLVLGGGPKIFARARAVIIELSVVSTYEGGMRAPEMQATLVGMGFKYGGELAVVRSPVTGEVVEFDALFFR